MPSSHLILSHHLLLLPSIPSSIRVLSNVSTLRMRWPNYWSFSFSISPSKEHPGLISFRMDWFDLAVQRTLKGLLQHHSSKASILRCSTFFTVQLSHPYITHISHLLRCFICWILLQWTWKCRYLFELVFLLSWSCSVVSDSLQHHELQHARPPCSSPSPKAYSNSCPLSWWCHPTISSSIIPFSCT